MLELGGYLKTMAPAAAAMVMTIALLIAVVDPVAYASPLQAHTAAVGTQG